MAGLSLQELADRMEGIVTKQALSRYELGVMEPSGKVVIALSKGLDVRPDYFFQKNSISLGEISFRKRLRLSKKDQDVIIEKIKDFISRYLDLEMITNSMVDFVNPIAGIDVNSFADVERAAMSLRNSWELGNGPIYNVLQTFETKGFKVYVVHVTDQFDGIATFVNEAIPVIVVNETQIERMRFTSVHEAAHLLLKLSDAIRADAARVEIYCHYFSSCFLLPPSKFIELLGEKRDYISINELIIIKETYGISLRAQLYRAKQLGIISELYYKKWSVYLSKKYGAKDEPGNYKGSEEPRRFNQLLSRAVAQEVVSLNKAAALADMPAVELSKKLNMPQ